MNYSEEVAYQLLSRRKISAAPFQGDYTDRGRTPGGFISYAAHLRAYGVYSALYGTGQSADRMIERGGFSAGELNALYPEWRNHIVDKNGNSIK